MKHWISVSTYFSFHKTPMLPMEWGGFGKRGTLIRPHAVLGTSLCVLTPHTALGRVPCTQWELSECYLFSGWQDSVRVKKTYLHTPFSESKPLILLKS